MGTENGMCDYTEAAVRMSYTEMYLQPGRTCITELFSKILNG